MNESPQRVAELLALYRRTHYAVALPDGSGATLRVGVPPPAPVVEWIGADDDASYLTACNPHSRELAPADNDARLAELRRRLRLAGARWLEGSAAIPHQPWREASLLAAGLPLDRLDALARAFEQNASVHVRAGAASRLRLHRRDWRGLVPTDAELEWDDG